LVQSRWWLSVWMLIVLPGCAGKGETVMLYPGALPLSRADIALSQEKLTVVIVPFEDHRLAKGSIGRRTHARGGYTSYTVWNDRPGQVVAEFMADYLKQKGWQVTVAQTAETARHQSAAEAVISGQVEEFSVQAVSKSLLTDISTRMQVALQARNQKDGSLARMTLHGSRAKTVVVFNDRDVQDAIDIMLKESMDRLMEDAKVEQGLLQVR